MTWRLATTNGSSIFNFGGDVPYRFPQWLHFDVQEGPRIQAQILLRAGGVPCGYRSVLEAVGYNNSPPDHEIRSTQSL